MQIRKRAHTNSSMSLKKCSVNDCSRTDIVAMQRQIQKISLPSSNDATDLHTDLIVFKYFCQIHFDRNELLKKNIRLLPASSLNANTPQSIAVAKMQLNANIVYTNRKRKSNDSPDHTKRIKVRENGNAYTLNEPANKQDDTKVNVLFHKFQKIDSDEYEDSEPTFMEVDDTDMAEDNDCIITDTPPQPIIDLSDDDDGDQGDSNKMIELILCNEPEPDELETSAAENNLAANEFLIELSNGLEDQEDVPQPLHVNFVTFPDGDAAPSIDLTAEKNDDSLRSENDDDVEEDVPVDPSNVNVEREGNNINTIDLTDEQIAEDEANVDVEAYRCAVIKDIRRMLSTKYPRVVQLISWNDESKQFEVSINKKSGFKADSEFHQYLREVVNQAIQSRGPKKFVGREKSKKQINEKVILNKDYAVKRSEEKRNVSPSPSSSSSSIAVLPSSSSASNTVVAPDATPPMTSKPETVNRILEKAESYLGVTVNTFQRIENLLQDGFKNRSILILVLRKIKLNESFSVLSDILCPNNDNCLQIYNKFLVKVSSTLKGLLRWPTNGREPLVIIDVFEMEIKKPKSTIAQSFSFCNRRQRYLVKFIICLTSNGYITHVSPPFYSMEGRILKLCLDTIPKNVDVVLNPNLYKFVWGARKQFKITSLFDCDAQAERNISLRVFERLRRFRLISSTLDLKNVSQLHRTLSLVACLYNLELEKEDE